MLGGDALRKFWLFTFKCLLSFADHHEAYYANAHTIYDFHIKSKDMAPEFDYNVRTGELVWGYMSSIEKGLIKIEGNATSE